MGKFQGVTVVEHETQRHTGPKVRYVRAEPRPKEKHLKFLQNHSNNSREAILMLHKHELEGYKTEIKAAKNMRTGGGRSVSNGLNYKYIEPFERILKEWEKDIRSPELAKKACKAHLVMMGHMRTKYGKALVKGRYTSYHPDWVFKEPHRHVEGTWVPRAQSGYNNSPVGPKVFHAKKRLANHHATFSSDNHARLMGLSTKHRQEHGFHHELSQPEYHAMLGKRLNHSAFYHPKK